MTAEGMASEVGQVREINDLSQLLEEIHDTDLARRVTQVAVERAQDVTLHNIAQSLQDDVDQTIRTAAVVLHKLRSELADEPHGRSVGRVEEQLARAAGRLQRLILEVRPPQLERQGLATTLRVFLAGVNEETGLACEVIDELHREPPPETQINMYRIAYEAIDNTRKYAHATRVTVEIREYAGGFMVRVIDDGRGFDQAALAGQDQLGFLIMRQRAELRDGWWQAHSAPGEGTTVEVWMPGESQAARTASSGGGVIVVE